MIAPLTYPGLPMEDQKKYHIYAKDKSSPLSMPVRFNNEVYKDADVARGRADQLSVQYPDKVFSVYVVNARSG